MLLTVGFFFHKENPSRSIPGATTSIIIAAHNEAEFIATTITSLLEQTVRPDEIIVVDDRSTDSTPDIVRSFSGDHDHIRLIRVLTSPPGSSPKKHALAQGIAAATGELLCFTDADCVPPPRWLERMVHEFDRWTGVVIGCYAPLYPSSEQRVSLGTGILRMFLRFEKFRSLALSCGSTTLGYPWTASGGSFAYRKLVFEEIGGFASHKGSLSGDDDLFVHDVRRKTDWKVRVVLSPQATVGTRVPDTLAEFLLQRRRHFSAGRYYRRSSQILLAVYHTANILSLLSVPFSIIVGPLSLLYVYVAKLCADGLLLWSAERHMKRFRDWVYFVPLEWLYAVYIIVVGLLGFVGNVRWNTWTKR